MLDVGRKSGTPGGIADRSGSEPVDWNDHGPTGRLYIPSFPLIMQIRPTSTRRGPSSRTMCAHQASKRIRRRVRRKPGAVRILKRGQNMLDNLVVERFREGHNNIELKKHLCLYPSTGLQDLIGACVRFETHVELGARAYKPNEGMYTVKGNEPV